jgi:hypothetical protein
VTDLPTGMVTFLFTDIEGSTRLLQELGEGYQEVQKDHMRLFREAIAEGSGGEEESYALGTLCVQREKWISAGRAPGGTRTPNLLIRS